jgi:hypothetical protein
MNTNIVIPGDVFTPRAVGVQGLPNCPYLLAQGQAGKGVGHFNRRGNAINIVWQNIVHGTMHAQRFATNTGSNKS